MSFSIFGKRELCDQETSQNSRRYLIAQLILDVTLDTAQHERPENHVQTAKLMFVEFAAFIFCSVLDVFGEPFVELVVRIKKTWHDEMQQSPQLYTADSINGEIQMVGIRAPCMEF